MIIMLSIFGIYLVADVKRSYILWALIPIAVIGFVLVAGSSNRRNRIITNYFGCNEETRDLCVQSLAAQHAFGSGGIWGVGIGGSREKWQYLPLAWSDFIYAIVGEELGFIGSMTIIILFLLLGAGLLIVTMQHHDLSTRIMAAGIMAWIVGQAAVNIGAVDGVFPALGVPLPFMSSGGSAALSCLAAIGISLSFARTLPGAQESIKVTRKQAKKVMAVVSTTTKETVKSAPKKAARRISGSVNHKSTAIHPQKTQRSRRP
jgi:cell division protein FtsW